MQSNCGAGEKSPLNCKEIKLVNLKGDQLWLFTGRTDAEAETPVFWSSDVNKWLIRKVPDAGKDWGKKEKTASEDEMAGWTWNWANFGKWWGTGRPGVLQSMGSQRFGHDWVTEQQQEEEQDIITGHLQILGRVGVLLLSLLRADLHILIALLMC